MNMGDEGGSTVTVGPVQDGTPAAPEKSRIGIIVAAVLVAAAVIAGGLVWLTSDDDSGDSVAFGPTGFRGLKAGMSKADALESGALGVDPVAIATGCQDYAFADGPKPNPQEMAEDAAAEQELADAQRELQEAHAKEGAYPRVGASAQETADYAERRAATSKASDRASAASSDLTKRSQRRIKAANAAGGASFGEDKLRLIGAPPGARTPEGIGRDSTIAALKAAYEGRGLVLESENRYEMPMPGQPDWVIDFDIKDGKVTTMLLLNTKIRCKR